MASVCFTVFVLVDLHLRTKADLYSFMQFSFVKIQDLIGYVSEYMLITALIEIRITQCKVICNAEN